MKSKKFTKAQINVLTEIYRRLNYFHNGDLNKELLLLATTSTVKCVCNLDIIKTYGDERVRCWNWYGLTDNGKQFFSHYITKYRLSEQMNLSLADGSVVIEFDKNLLPCAL